MDWLRTVDSARILRFMKTSKLTGNDKEIRPKHVQVGVSLFIERDGKWFNEDGKEIQVKTMSLEDLMEILCMK